MDYVELCLSFFPEALNSPNVIAAAVMQILESVGSVTREAQIPPSTPVLNACLTEPIIHHS